MLPRVRFCRSLVFSFSKASIKAKLHQNLAIWVGNLAGLGGAENAASKTCLITQSIPMMLSRPKLNATKLRAEMATDPDFRPSALSLSLSLYIYIYISLSLSFVKYLTTF